MKITIEHYIELKSLVSNWIKDNNDFIAISLQNGHSKTRLCFDVFHKISFIEGLRPFDWYNKPLQWRLYDYLNDNNIECAMLKILKELNVYS